MNFNEQNSSGLLGLVAALKAGMDPATAQSLFSGIEQQQGMQIAQRQERLSGLADLLSQNAQAGLPYGGAQALMDAQPGPAGPAAQNILESLYPGAEAAGQAYQPPLNQYGEASGQVPSAESYDQVLQSQQNVVQSPAYQPDPMAEIQLQQAQTDLMGSMQEQSFASEWPVFQTDMTRARAQGIDPYEAFQRFVMKDPANAALVSSDGGKTAQSIMKAIWGDQALAMSGVPQQ